MTKQKYPGPDKAKLSIVIPAYNAEQWIQPTLEKLWKSLLKSTWKSVEIIVVDDGSKDNTASAAKKAKITTNIKVISKNNEGRFLARKTGIDAANGDYIFFIDSRVFSHPNSFKYLVKQLNKSPEAVVWNGHVEIERTNNPYARFWYAVTYIAWRKYMAKPRLLHYGLKEFDYYPKGTTCFFVPKDVISRAYRQFKTGYKDLNLANDDSSLIRYIAKEHDIYIAPNFAFTYNSRSTAKAFIRHTKHRGIVLIDGYFHKGTRYFYPLIFYLLLVPAYLAAVILRPVLLLLFVPVLLLIFASSMILRVPAKDSLALTYIMPLFALFYTIGLYKGVYLRIKDAKNK